MKYHVTADAGKFAYLQIYEQLREDIVRGIIPFGKKLPSKRLLAEEISVSVITVEHAYSILADEGYVEARQRSGYFVIYRESDFVSPPTTAEKAFLSQNAAKTRYAFPFSVLSRVMRKVLSEYGEAILIKSPNHGCEELRTAVCMYLARNNGIFVRPSQVVIGSGTEYLYSLVARLFGHERLFAIEEPSYDKIRDVYDSHGVRYEKLPLGTNGIKTHELERTNATVLHITPFHSFPSGVSADASKRREYLRWAERKKGFLIEDNYDSELTVSRKNEDTVFSMSEGGRVIYLNTFSETIAPSMRIGYMVLPENLLGEFEEKLGFLSCTVPVFEQYVLAELLNGGEFERHINRVRRERRKEKKQKQQSGSIPQATLKA